MNDDHHLILYERVIHSHYGFFIGYLKNQIEAPISIGASLFMAIDAGYKINASP